jgi:hypothetical protein
VYMARGTSLCLSACKDLGAEFRDLEEADMQVVPDCPAAELPGEDHEQFTVLTE